MTYDKELIAGKLRRWEKYMDHYKLPAWEDIPDFGLYMEQVTALLKEYLDYLPPELKEEQFITAATINNYVRKKVIPEPIKKKYYRIHIVYLILICTLKQSLSIATLQTMIPLELSSDQLHVYYDAYRKRHRIIARYFCDQVRLSAASILDHEEKTELATENTEELIVSAAVVGGFCRLLAEKLLLLNGETLETGGSIELE
ncbi:MAG: DUF1836 domain-containing protein [Clostridia bacterium]|nr:DUF1836 domain-containing protein [Clostridia bacterium]